MAEKRYAEIVRLVREAARLAKGLGIDNIIQPGLIKEMIVCDLLGHRLISTKRDADACDPDDPSVLYEYLSCKEGGSGQFDRMFARPPEKRAVSLRRITRNAKVFLAVFRADDQLDLKAIHELDPKVVCREVELQLDASANAISHVGLSEQWAAKHGRLVYPKPAKEARRR